MRRTLAAVSLLFALTAGVLFAQTGTRVLAGSIKEKLYLRAAVCQNTTAITAFSLPATDPAVAACVTGTNTQYGVLDFADGANALSAQTQWMLPADWSTVNGGIDLTLYWFSATTTGDVVWQVATACVANAETGDPAFNAATVFTADTAQGTTLQYNTASATAITVTGCAAGEILNLKIVRDPAHGSDTHAATARLVGIELTYRRVLVP